jgi:hypothetical protein
MDYAFVPGGTTFEVSARAYLRWRSPCAIVNTGDVTLASFVDALSNSSSVNRPVNDLGIGCHGSEYGLLQMQLDSQSPALATVDDVMAVESRGTVTLPSAVLDPRPIVLGVPLAAYVRIVGCGIGAAKPFLERLKAALGGHVLIIGTRHFDVFQSITVGGAVQSVVRFFLYNFAVTTPTPFERKDDVVEAFHKKEFEWYDGTRVPQRAWEARVPRDVVALGFKSTRFSADLPEGYELPPFDGWDHSVEPVGPFTMMIPTNPFLTEAARRSFIRAEIKSRPEFAANHPFPLHKQRGYASFDAFVDGYDWLEQPNASGAWMGYRHVYLIQTPIFESADAKKMLHDSLSPNAATNKIGLLETDTRLFSVT